LLFPNFVACRKLAGLPDNAPIADVLSHHTLSNHISKALGRLADEGGGTSRFATRVRFMIRAPDEAAGEVTDKGYINQRAVLRNCADDVVALQGNDPGDWIGLVQSE
jgi:feruloyl-CoA synthase